MSTNDENAVFSDADADENESVFSGGVAVEQSPTAPLTADGNDPSSGFPSSHPDSSTAAAARKQQQEKPPLGSEPPSSVLTTVNLEKNAKRSPSATVNTVTTSQKQSAASVSAVTTQQVVDGAAVAPQATTASSLGSHHASRRNVTSFTPTSNQLNVHSEEYQQRRSANQTPLAAEQELHEKKNADRKKAGFVFVGVFIAIVIVLVVVTQTRKTNGGTDTESPVAPTTASTTPTPQPTQPQPTGPPLPPLAWTNACTQSGPFDSPASEMAYLKRRVDQLLGYGTRVAGSNSSGYRSVHSMVSTMAACDGVWSVETDDFEDDTPHGKKQFSNIVSTFQHGNESLGHLVLTAHFDSKYYEDITFLGACDSAVPCVQLLEIMKKVSAAVADEMAAAGGRRQNEKFISQNLPKITVMFFDGEEAFVEWRGTDNTYGSRHLAKQWKADGRMASITMFVLLDLLGPKSPMIYNYFYQKTGGSYEKLRKIEMSYRAEGKAQTSATMFQVRSLTLGMEDDHIPWLNGGVPVLHVIPYPFPKVWHTVADDGDAVDYATVYDQVKIFEKFTLTYRRAPAARRRKKK